MTDSEKTVLAAYLAGCLIYVVATAGITGLMVVVVKLVWRAF